MPMITIHDTATAAGDDNGLRPAYLAEPVPVIDRPGPWPGVVVIHDAIGMTDDIKEQADWLAAAGHVALVPDLYNGRSMVRCINSTFGQLIAQQGPVFTQIEAARAHLAALPSCTGTVGVIGYCMGGAFALLLAARPGYAAASVNYGPLPKNLDEVLAGSCPMVASYGAKDFSLKGAARRVELGLARAGVPADVKEYPNGRHSFINRLAVASPLAVLMRVGGDGYDHDSAADAKQRILAFFDQHLRTEQSLARRLGAANAAPGPSAFRAPTGSLRSREVSRALWVPGGADGHAVVRRILARAVAWGLAERSVPDPGLRRVSTARRPISKCGMATLVSCGRNHLARSESSKEITETSSGTFMPKLLQWPDRCPSRPGR